MRRTIRPVSEMTDEELRARLDGLEGTSSGPGGALRETLRVELEQRRPAPVRILDLRLVLDRDDRVRASVDGRELVRHESAAGALRLLADRIAGRPRLEQLDALRVANAAPVLRGPGGLVAASEDDDGPEAA